ncbi:MAG: trypsin-like peptidase domain-containing protein [Candidatus Kuenenbacteria bacterium]
MSKFVHPTRFFKTHFLKNNDNNKNNNLIKVIIISLIIGLIGGIIGQRTMNYLNKKNLLLILEQSKQNFPAEKQIVVEKKDEVIINQDEKVEQLIPELAPTVVNIFKKKENKITKNTLDQIYSSEDLAGNGFIITNDGWIISNNQVIKDSIEKYIIVTYDGKFQEIENLIKDPLTGIVFLKIKTSNNLTSVKLTDWDEVKIGQSVLILNKIDFLEKKFMLSNIANLSFKKFEKSLSSSEKIDNYILIQDKIESNYNGSPLFNLKGEVVGILFFLENGLQKAVDLKFVDATEKNLQTAIGVNYFKNIINKTLQTKQINRPYLGINYLNLNSILTKELNQNGALITKDLEKQIFAIKKDSPALNKLKQGDVIIKVEGEEIDEKKSLTSLINEYQPNQNIKLTIIRGTKEMEVEVRLGISL